MALRLTRVFGIATAGILSSLSPAVAGEFGPCDTDAFGADARCGRVTVPEARSQPDGRQIDLRVVVLPAASSIKKEPLFLLAGGPGQAGTDLVELALGPFSPVREVRDIVLVDQRGTGESNRIDCPVDAAETPQGVFGELFDRNQLAGCLQAMQQHADPTLYTTDIVVDDLDAVRDRLGYDRVLLWGGSGGTRTALVWMRRHPERVVAAVLDGVTPTSFRAPSTMARGCQETIDKVFAECRAQPDCYAAYPDLTADFDQLMALFDAGPVATHIVDQQGKQVPVEMHRGDFGYAIRGLIYRSQHLPKLPAMIHQAAIAGDVQPFAQAYWMRQVGLRPYVAMGVHFGIYCAEDLPFIDPEEVAGFTAGTFVGRYLYDQYNEVCKVWEAVPVERSFLDPVHSEIPVLIFSGYYDPSTPASLGHETAAHLPNSRHVVVRNESHGAEFGCGRQAAIDFMIQGSLDDLGPICEDQEPIRYETAP